MLPDSFLRVLQYEGVVAIASQGCDGPPHLINTWNSYLQVRDDKYLLAPVGGMHKTEANVSANRSVLLTVGSREVEGRHGPGTGFLVKGTSDFYLCGSGLRGYKGKVSLGEGGSEGGDYGDQPDLVSRAERAWSGATLERTGLFGCCRWTGRPPADFAAPQAANATVESGLFWGTAKAVPF